MDEFLFQLGNVMLLFFFISIISIFFLVLITGRYMDRQLAHLTKNAAKQYFSLFPRPIANAFIYSIGILLNGRYGKKAPMRKLYGNLNMRDYARPIDKFFSFSFYGSWGLVLAITLVWFILRWFAEGNIVFIEFFDFLTGKE